MNWEFVFSSREFVIHFWEFVIHSGSFWELPPGSFKCNHTPPIGKLGVFKASLREAPNFVEREATPGSLIGIRIPFRLSRSRCPIPKCYFKCEPLCYERPDLCIELCNAKQKFQRLNSIVRSGSLEAGHRCLAIHGVRRGSFGLLFALGESGFKF